MARCLPSVRIYSQPLARFQPCETEMRMQGDRTGVVAVANYSHHLPPLASFTANYELHEQRPPDAAAVHMLMDINRVFQ